VSASANQFPEYLQLCGLIGGIGLILIGTLGWIWHKTKFSRIPHLNKIITGVYAICLFILGYFYYILFVTSDPTCYVKKSKLLDSYASLIEQEAPSTLGKQKGCLHVVDASSIMQLEKQTSIWVHTPSPQIFNIFNNKRQWNRWDDPGYCHVLPALRGKCDISDEKASKVYFEKKIGHPIPAGLHPPYGSIAVWANEHPKEYWEQFGWVYWACEIRTDSILYGEYERGFVLGVFPLSDRDSHGQVYFLEGDQNGGRKVQWVQSENVSSPSCDRTYDIK
jgi:hypothetical protein